jgi:S-adenosylmethionine:tRNA ribosyltransferase-isomerase
VDSDRVLTAYDYILPRERIAQAPAIPRDSARLLVVGRSSDTSHHHFRELPKLLQPGDLLVLNNTRVLPARLYGRKLSGLPVEVLLLEPVVVPPSPSPGGDTATADLADEAGLEPPSLDGAAAAPASGLAYRRRDQAPPPPLERGDIASATAWLALVKPGRRLKPGTQIYFGDGSVTAKVLETDAATKGRVLHFTTPDHAPLCDWLERLGQVPLPPYIAATDSVEGDQYQTVYADAPGAVAAPTAGLHFTPELLDTLAESGIHHTFVTLHVGVGTFRPVEVEDITQHQMHGEWVDVSPETVAQIAATKAAGGRVIAVGTTAVRSLEGAAQGGTLQPFQGKTQLYIYPGYEWRVVDGLITNFHLPKSSLLMLVSALIGRLRLLELYQLAIAAEYRFYSFGDAMLILPEATGGQAAAADETGVELAVTRPASEAPESSATASEDPHQL